MTRVESIEQPESIYREPPVARSLANVLDRRNDESHAVENHERLVDPVTLASAGQMTTAGDGQFDAAAYDAELAARPAGTLY